MKIDGSQTLLVPGDGARAKVFNGQVIATYALGSGRSLVNRTYYENVEAEKHSSYYFYWVQMDPGVRDEVARDLYAAGVYTTFRYPLLHRVPLYGATDQSLPHADEAAERTLCLPLHNALDDSDVRTVATALRKAMEARAGR